MDKSIITQRLKEAGLKQRQIACNLGVSPQAVHAVIAGKKRTFRIQEAIAKAIGKPVEEVFPDPSKEAA